jgi:hypothetical protein
MRDHSEQSDFESINSFDSASESLQTHRKEEEEKIRIKISKEHCEVLDNPLFEAVYSNDYQRVQELVNNFQTLYDKQKKVNIRDKY